MPIQKKDLVDQIGSPGPHPFLYCGYCQAEASAYRGDYFLLPDTHVFRCCGKPMRLATKRTVYTFLDNKEEN